MEAMKGQIAGVDVLQGSWTTGSNIQPLLFVDADLSHASNDPLFVVDGIPMTAGTSLLIARL